MGRPVLIWSFDHVNARGIINAWCSSNMRCKANFCEELTKPDDFAFSMSDSVVFSLTCRQCSSSLLLG